MFVVLALSLSVIPVITSPIGSPLIIVLNNDEPVMYTTNKISELLDYTPIIVPMESIQEKFLISLAEIAAGMFLGYFLRDEQNAGWIIYKDWSSSWISFAINLKIGKAMWVRYIYIAGGGSTLNPLWYGGRNLGYAGI